MAEDRYSSRASQVSLVLHDTMLQAPRKLKKPKTPYCTAKPKSGCDK
jgi:hypothetical protein